MRSLTYPAEFLQQVLGQDLKGGDFLEEALGIRLSSRGETLLVEGPEDGAEICGDLVGQLHRLYLAGIRLGRGDLKTVYNLKDVGF